MIEMKWHVLAAALAIFALAGCSGPATPAATGGSAPVIDSFTADPPGINQGDSTRITWRVNNAEKVVIDNGIGTVDRSGDVTVKPAGDTCYRMTATNPFGASNALLAVKVSNQGGNSDMPASTASNNPALSPSSPLYQPEISKFSAIPAKIDSGDKATLSWAVKNADNVTIDRGIGMVRLNGAVNVKLEETAVYTLTACNGAGSVTASTTVKVGLPAAPVIKMFMADPSTIVEGYQSMLSWDVTDADLVRISGLGNVKDSGTMKVHPGSTTIYTLVATNPGGSVQSTCQVTVEEQ